MRFNNNKLSFMYYGDYVDNTLGYGYNLTLLYV